MATSDRPAMWWTSTVVSSHGSVNGAICSAVTTPLSSPRYAGITPRSTFSRYPSHTSHRPRTASERNDVRDENASDAPMRNMNTGAAVGPPRKLMTWPIGLVHVSGAPQCQSTCTPIMNRTARPRARSNARTRGGAAGVACIARHCRVASGADPNDDPRVSYRRGRPLSSRGRSARGPPGRAPR